MSWFWRLEERGFTPLTTLLIALLSLTVAAASLYFGIDSQKTDREYKEITIRPYLMIQWDPNQVAIAVRNVGLGPAVIKKVIIKSAEKCEVFSSDEQALEIQNRFKEVFVQLFGTVIEMIHPADGGIAWHSINPLLPEMIIYTGDSETIFKIDPTAAADLMKRMPRQMGDIEQTIGERIAHIPIRVQYCSITGKWCSKFKPDCEFDKQLSTTVAD
jgi:hypothetical protein